MSMLLVILFFFKQKTAYEMRISDWSSDVCSSDLDGKLVGQRRAALLALVEVGEARRQAGAHAAGGLHRIGKLGRVGAGERHHGDRKSVVWGKGVSVRVDLGGRRIIKQTRHNTRDQTRANTPT